MVAISRLEPSESIDVDSAAIAALFRVHGAVIAEDMLMDHVAELTERIAALDAQAQATGQLPKGHHAEALERLATDIGLTSLAHTLAAVAHAANAGNRAALPALWDRVKRVGNRSLCMLWDLPQLRM